MTEQNTLSISELKQKAEEGNSHAQFYLAYCLLNGKDIASDSDAAFQWLNKSAELGNPEAQLALGLCFMRGPDNGLLRDEFIDIRFQRDKSQILKKDNEHLYLCILFAYNYLVAAIWTGNDDFDDNLAFSWLEKSAEQGCGEAQYWLARCYQTGTGIQKNSELAFFWFKNNAEQGHVDAFYRLALCYVNGEGVKKNNELAINWLTKWVDLQQEKYYDEDYFNACLLLGDLYADGKAVQQNYELASEWYLKVKNISNDKICAIEESMPWAAKWNKTNPELKSEHEKLNSRKSPWLNLLGEVNSKVSGIYCKLATISGISDKDACIWHERLANFDHAESQLWLAKYYLQGGLLEQLAEFLSEDSRKQLIEQGYRNAWYWALKAVENGCAEANLIIGFLDYCNINGSIDEMYTDFKAALVNTQKGIAEYFLMIYYRYNTYLINKEEEQQLVDQYRKLADLEKVWSYYRIDKLLEIDASLYEKLEVLLKDSELIAVNRELEAKNRQLRQAQKELEETMSMFSHKFRGALDTIIYNTTHENKVNLYTVEAAQTMRGLLDIFSIISTDHEILKDKIKLDKQGNGRLSTVFIKTLDMIMLHLLSASGAEKIQQHYMAYAKSHALCGSDLSYKSWIEDCIELEQQLQVEWEQSFAHLLSESENLESRLTWLEERFFKLELSGFEETNIQFRTNGVTESFLMILLNEILVNAFKYYSSGTRQPVVLEWIERDGQQVLICRNPSVRSERTIIKGSRKGHAFLSTLARKTGSQFVKPQPQDEFVLEFVIPNELLLAQ